MDNTELEQRKALRKRQRRAAERLLDNSSLRDALTDEQGKQLLDWGLAQADAAAKRTAKLPDAEADPILDDQVTAVSDVMRQVNRLVAIGPSATQENIGDNLKKLLTGLRAVRQTALTTSQNELLEKLARQDGSQRDSAALFADLMRLIGETEPVATGEATPEQPDQQTNSPQAAAAPAPKETMDKPAEQGQEEGEEGIFAGLRRFMGRRESEPEASDETSEEN